ncbi:unnamed protein product [Rotaria magnacalcarata]|nr:unnamed protein product [Rotaria magnacalcarata]CAF4147811.1 unnamed protein product [Rotaria magnacalcarata]
MNYNNNINQQHLLTNPHITPQSSQQPIPTFTNTHIHPQTITNPQFHNINQHSADHQQHSHQHQNQDTRMPMESECDDNFITVIRKNKKAKTDHVQFKSPSSTSTTSTPSPTTDGSTSSTNTSSILTNNRSSHNNRSYTNTHTQNRTNNSLEPNEISSQARRYAETRYPFPPFIIKFKQDVDEKLIINSVLKHFNDIYKANIILAGHRLKEKRELLLFVDNRESFVMFFDDDKWPCTLDSIDYIKTRPNHLPPQFSIILRNVPIDRDINLLLEDIKIMYPEVVSVFRLSNKDKRPTTIVRLDIMGIKVIDELLSKKHIYIHNIRYPLTEYLAPAKVLVCTKCFQIGHFRSTCKSSMELCKICGTAVDDLKEHKDKCNNNPKCIRCAGEHDSNDHRCPNIKKFRALLTKSLLNASGPNNHNRNNATNYWFKDQDFPVLNGNRRDSHQTNELHIANDNRIDDLINKMNRLEVNLDKIFDLNSKYLDQIARTQLMLAKHDHELQLLQHDVTFQREFVSQFISPLGQVLIDIIPVLVKQDIIKDKTILCPSLTELITKLAKDLPMWTNRFVQIETNKSKLSNDFLMMNQDINSSNNEARLSTALT